MDIQKIIGPTDGGPAQALQVPPRKPTAPSAAPQTPAVDRVTTSAPSALQAVMEEVRETRAETEQEAARGDLEAQRAMARYAAEAAAR